MVRSRTGPKGSSPSMQIRKGASAWAPGWPANKLSELEEVSGFDFVLRGLVFFRLRQALWRSGGRQQQQHTSTKSPETKRRSSPPAGTTDRMMDLLLHFNVGKTSLAQRGPVRTVAQFGSKALESTLHSRRISELLPTPRYPAEKRSPDPHRTARIIGELVVTRLKKILPDSPTTVPACSHSSPAKHHLSSTTGSVSPATSLCTESENRR